MIVKQGISASPGVAIGPALVLDTEEYRIPRRTIHPSQVADQVGVLDAALDASRQELHRQTKKLRQLIDEKLRPALTKAGIPILDYEQLNDAQKAHLQDYFRDAIEPILTPLAVDVGHPFPFISNLGLNLAIQLKDSKHKKPRFVRIKIPPNRPRWVELNGGGYVPLEQVIAANLTQLFPTAKQINNYLFRVVFT